MARPSGVASSTTLFGPDKVERLKWIDAMDKAHGMIMQLGEDDRRLIMAVAHSAVGRDRGPRWTKLAHILGLNDPRIVKRNYRDALTRLYYGAMS